MENSEYGKLCPYSPASWMADLKNIPPVKVKLAMTPTPIHKWNLPGVPENFEVSIKRDDMTGSTLSGNKVRKLEFVLGHILQNGFKHIITCGGIQSNHCRATAIISSQFGIKCHLLLVSESADRESQMERSSGNFFLMRMCDANIYHLAFSETVAEEVAQKLSMLTEEIFKNTGEKAYNLYPGASDPVGLFGYLDAWNELMEQGVRENFDDVVVVCGSGGTIAGLAMGNYLTGKKVEVHGVTVGFGADFLHNHVNEMLIAMGLEDIKPEDIVDIIEGYVGVGYATSTEEDHNLYKTIASKTGILCDPVYVGKGVKGLISELKSSPGRFKGERILFVHTGGVYGLYDGRMFNMFSDDKVHDWMDVNKSPAEFF